MENKQHGDLFTNGKNLTAKTLPGDFQVTTSETPLLLQQAVTSKVKVQNTCINTLERLNPQITT